MNQALALAGQGAPLSQMANNYSLAQQQLAQAREQAEGQALGGWIGTGLNTLGGLLSLQNGNNSTVGGDIYNWMKS